jgi:hypothetical protein
VLGGDALHVLWISIDNQHQSLVHQLNHMSIYLSDLHSSDSRVPVVAISSMSALTTHQIERHRQDDPNG